MNRGRGLIVAGASLVLLVTVWAASTTPVGIVDFAEPKKAAPTSSQQTETGREGGGGPAATPGGLVEWLDLVFVVLLTLIAIAALSILVGAVWLRRRRAERARRRVGAGIRVGLDDAFHAEVPSPIAQAAQDQLAAVMAGSPRNAIVACWLALEDAAATAGIPRDPAETSAEFTARALSTYAVHDAAISALSALYREARFSEHTLTEAHRSAAVGALRRLRADLARADRAASEPVATP